MHKYIKSDEELGQGGYGVVRLAYVRNEDDSKGRPVAIKKLHSEQMDREGIDIPTIREVKLLKNMHHKNIIELVDIFVREEQIYLVLECCKTDLYKIINDNSIVLSPADIKCYLKQILEAVKFCHANWILHRDLKPPNLLVTHEGIVKLTDFGLARSFAIANEKLSPQAVTIWYRAPEMLFGSENYTQSIDMWSVGCIFAEMMLRTPLFPGTTEIDMLSRISSLLGTPTEKRWPGVSTLPCYIEFSECNRTPLSSLFVGASPDALELLSELLNLDPNKRLTAQQALDHPFFMNYPLPSDPKNMQLNLPATQIRNTTNHNESKALKLNPAEFNSVRRKLQWN